MTAPHWSADRMAAYDCESTGVSVHDDRIVTAAIVHHTPGERPRTITWILNPGIPIPPEAAAIHGWSTERLEAELAGREAVRTTADRGPVGIAREDALFEIAGQAALAVSTSTPLIAFNAAFDLSMLEAECLRQGVPTLADRLAPKGVRGIVDPFVLDKHYSRRKGSRKLIDQCGHYRVLHGGAHDAAADALAALRLVPRMVKAYPELGKRQLPWLFQSQIQWRTEQCASLRAYFDRKGTEHDGICPTWPVHASCCAPVGVPA